MFSSMLENISDMVCFSPTGNNIYEIMNCMLQISVVSISTRHGAIN